MGAGSSSEFSSSEIQEFKKHYTACKTSYDYRFGQVTIYQHNESRQLVLCSTKHFDSVQLRSEFLNDVKRKQFQQHPSLCKIIGYSCESGSNLCGVSQQVTIYTEFYQDDLLRELKVRTKSQERYTEQEVYYLLDTLVSSLAYLQEQNTSHGDVDPQNIVLTGNGQAKILNNRLVSQFKSNFERRLQGQTNMYLAPEQLELVNTKYISPSYNLFKADIYSLGVTMLYICLLNDPISLYNFSQNRVYHEQVDALLTQVLQSYSYQLTDLIRQMLMQDPSKRPSAMELRGLIGNRPTQTLNQSRVVQPQQQVVSQPQQLFQSQVVPQQVVPQQMVPQQVVPQQMVAQQVVPQQLMQSGLRQSMSNVQQGPVMQAGGFQQNGSLIRNSMAQRRF